MHEYGADFYSFVNSFAVRSAESIVPLVRAALPVSSVADFGCGQGAWLSVWRAQGVEITGLDGPYVDRTRLLVPADAFHPTDLAAPQDLGRRFDLAQSLETAEHLPAAAARAFVRTLARHADCVLFSAAVPGQGGEFHVNEQSLEYWRQLFAGEGYRPVDLIRPALRGSKDVQIWYRCNTLLYVNDAGLGRLSAEARTKLVPEDAALADYWPMRNRLQQSVVRLLPIQVVNKIARANVAMMARRRARMPASA